MNDLLVERMRRSPPATQTAAARMAIRHAIAAYGPMKTEADIISACRGLAEGLYGTAWDRADELQRRHWSALVELEYRRILAESNATTDDDALKGAE